jgi:hypothetical protein
MSLVNCPVDPDCALVELTRLPQHVYEVHTEDHPNYNRWDIVERCLTQAVRNTAGTHPSVPIPAVRNDCAFCHRERSPKDDNHAPECPYWVFFGEG